MVEFAYYAEIAHEIPGAPSLATVAAFNVLSGELSVHTRPVPQPAQRWRAPLHAQGGDSYIAPQQNRTLLFMKEGLQPAGLAAAHIVGGYLDSGYIPHEIDLDAASLSAWRRIAITTTLSTIAVRYGEKAYLHAETTEFVGSALFAVFQAVCNMSPEAVHSVRYNRGSATQPFPFSVRPQH